MSPTQSARIASPDIIGFLTAVVDHHWATEQADYREQDPQDRAGHVFEALSALRSWLDASDDLVMFHETVGTDPVSMRYTLVRFYRRAAHTFRVRIERNSYQHQSIAIAEVLTTGGEWQGVVDNDPSHWHESTSFYGDKGTGQHPEPGFDTLRRLADTLAGEAALIVPA